VYSRQPLPNPAQPEPNRPRFEIVRGPCKNTREPCKHWAIRTARKIFCRRWQEFNFVGTYGRGSDWSRARGRGKYIKVNRPEFQYTDIRGICDAGCEAFSSVRSGASKCRNGNRSLDFDCGSARGGLVRDCQSAAQGRWVTAG